MADSQNNNNDKKESIWAAMGRMALVIGSLYIAHEYLKYNSIKSRQEKQAICDKDGVAIDLSPAQWAEFWQNGFIKIGRTLSDNELSSLKQRVSDIMTGKIKYGDKLLMQIDQSKTNKVKSKDDYDQNDLGTQGQSRGFKGADAKYRKIGESGCGLECDDKFLQFMRKPVFKRICEKIYGKHAKIGMYRAMIFNKPSVNDGGGSFLPWHQDGGNWWSVDRDPLIFCWTALFDVDKSNGCVQCIKGSYNLGIVSQRGHTLNAESVKKYCKQEDIVYLEGKAGETWLVHNWTIHRSGTNTSNKPRWAFSANYIDARTKMLNPKPKDASSLADVNCKFGEIFASPFD